MSTRKALNLNFLYMAISMFDVTVMDNVTELYQLLQCACTDESSTELCYYGVAIPLTAGQEIPPRGWGLGTRLLLKLTVQWRRSHSTRTSNLPPDHDKEQTSPLASLKARWPAEEACRNVRRLRRSLELENASDSLI